MEMLQTMVLATLMAWASGIRLYLVICAIGLLGHFQYMELPPGLKVLEHPWVMGAAGFMLAMEFLVDKIPGLDTLWDTVHTFIRIPAGAFLAAGATGDSVTAMTVVAGLLGGTITAGTHFTKAGSRAVINSSPEPFSNVGASFTEDALAISGIWLALTHPIVFLVAFAIFVLLMIWLLPKLVRGIRSLMRTFQPRALPEPGR